MKTSLIKSKYEIVELVREDIISFCYVGKTHYSHLPVIIWRYKKEWLSSALVTRLINLSESLIHVTHPALLTMLDYHYDGHSFYTIHEGVSQFVTLDTYIKQQETVDLKQLWKFSTQLLNLLLELEKKHLFCGSINVSNIIVTGDAEVKLSRTTLSVEIYKQVWAQLTVVEDCIFFAPEFISEKHYSLSSDMYSFGVLLTIFFSQRWPYKYSIYIDQIKKSIVEGPLDFEPVHAKIPDQLGRVVSVCLSPDPERRFRSFVELIKVYRGDLPFSKELESEPSLMIDNLKTMIKEKSVLGYSRLIKWTSVGLGFVLMLVVAYQLYLTYITAIPEVSVPHVTGLDASEAETLLDSYHLRSMISGTRHHPHVEKGVVIESKPPSGRIVKENRVIRLFVSKGVGPMLVPDMIGYAQESVENLVVDRGLLIEVQGEAYSMQYPKGTVISQEPMPNTFIGTSENIRLILSKGYPVDVSVKKAKPSFFQDKTGLRRVIVEFFVLKEWSSQDIAIFYTMNDKKEKIYSDLIEAGDNLKLEFELDVAGSIEVFFNNELTVKRSVNELDRDG